MALNHSKSAQYYPTQEPKDISPSSTTPWPTSKTANELVCFILLFMLWTVYCIIVFYVVCFYCTICLYCSLDVVYVLPIQLLGCHNCNKRLSCLVKSSSLKQLALKGLNHKQYYWLRLESSGTMLIQNVKIRSVITRSHRRHGQDSPCRRCQKAITDRWLSDSSTLETATCDSAFSRPQLMNVFIDHV